MTQHSLEQMPLAATRKELDREAFVVARAMDLMNKEIISLARQLEARKINQLIILGSGDSFFIGIAARQAFHAYAHITVTALQALEFACYGYPNLDQHCAIVLISSSARQSIIWDALDRAIETPAFVIGLTDNVEACNPIVQKSHAVITPRAEKIGWPTQTTAAALSTLLLLAVEWGLARRVLTIPEYEEMRAHLFSLPEKMQTALEDSRLFARTIAAEKFEKPAFTIIASGPNDGIALMASALLAEGPQRIGLPLPLEEFHHSLRTYTLHPGDPVILIATHPTCLQRSLDTAKEVQASQASLIGLLSDQTQVIEPYCQFSLNLPYTPEPLSSLLNMVPLQELSIQLAEERIKHGYNRPRL